LNNLGVLLEAIGKEREVAKVRKKLQQSSKPEVPEDLETAHKMAMQLKSQGRPAEAEPLLRKVLEGKEEQLESHRVYRV